ncbi:MAG: amidohydrolase [Bacteroidetes bacterium]|nr:MAG: amidohydrolase [Bacteroidota bacterium]
MINRLLCCAITISLLLLTACQTEQDQADLILENGKIYTVNPAQQWAEAIAIKDGRILAVGSKAEVRKFQHDSTEIRDLDGRFVMPGFIEGHGHFSGLGYSLMNLNFLKSKSWDEIVQMVAARAQAMPKGKWITGRGWHQEKWTTAPELTHHGYPDHYSLSALTPDHPVILRHASGHSAFANAKAMEIAGITKETPDPRGGHIVRNAQGEPIGVFEETAMELVYAAYNDYLASLSPTDLQNEWETAIRKAQDECLAKGITSFQDAGSTFDEIRDYQRLAESGALDLRLWVMARTDYNTLAANIDSRYPIIEAGSGLFTCRAIKSEVDGALGAFGAWLLEPYADKPGFVGQNTTELATVDSIAKLALAHDMQLCVHAIGDRANREVLDLFEAHFDSIGEQADRRWRIEHSQHLHPADIPRFAELGVIASMQAIHCTSDAPFVVKRLGEKRAREGAYPWRSLLDAGAVVTNGTDAPVEDVDPLPSLYASVTRHRPGTQLVFFPEQSMTRTEAIHSYTLANAYAAFEESWKGSLEVGKVADLVCLSENLVTCPDTAILDAQVLWTMVDGEVKWERE